eukprot:TRINITY_DN4258_c3_g1_i1.p1 TRINITY_DN4258_c3_g1~~TRINITY_DN4258_c3_g1_i1.p1  ORF type:complete len:500 (-),score=133.72 TRINITY_DN4258_c3_g1_i1:151-1650(-)
MEAMARTPERTPERDTTQAQIPPWRDPSRPRSSLRRRLDSVDDVEAQERRVQIAFENNEAGGNTCSTSKEAVQDWKWKHEDFPSLRRLFPEKFTFNPRSASRLKGPAQGRWQLEADQEDAEELWDGLYEKTASSSRTRSEGPAQRADLMASGFLSPKRHRMPRFPQNRVLSASERSVERYRKPSASPLQPSRSSKEQTSSVSIGMPKSWAFGAKITTEAFEEVKLEVAEEERVESDEAEEAAEAEEDLDEPSDVLEESAEAEKNDVVESASHAVNQIPKLDDAEGTTDEEKEDEDAEIARLSAELSAAAEAVKASTSAEERHERAKVFKEAHAAAVKALQRQVRQTMGEETSELDIASEVALRLSLLQMGSGTTQVAVPAKPEHREPRNSQKAPTLSTEDRRQTAMADVAVSCNNREMPPTSNFWDFPLSRHEKKARLFMIEQRFAELERRTLVGQIRNLRKGGDCKDYGEEDSDCEESESISPRRGAPGHSAPAQGGC